MNKDSLSKLLFPVVGVLTFTPWISSSIALFLGLVLALAFGNPYSQLMGKYTHRMLALSVVGLGGGMNLKVIAEVGLQGVGYTVVGILFTFTLGSLLGRALKIPKATSTLISVGTAICGGSAIAAVTPVIRAKQHETTVALATVFILNALALMSFPILGHIFELTQDQFGLWSALAIHDTSSVVGATLEYGSRALEVGTTVKLARALWIIPVALLISAFYKQDKSDAKKTVKAKKPWFILGFIIMAAVVTWVPELQDTGHFIEGLARKLMVLTLFFIGSSLTWSRLKSVGVKPFLQGVLLWIVVSVSTLLAILSNVIQI